MTFGGTPVVREPGRTAAFAVGRPPVEPDEGGGASARGRRARRARRCRRADARPGPVDDERDALQVHPHRGVARARIARHERERSERVVRAVERREQQLEVAGAPGLVRPPDELHVLGAEIAGRGVSGWRSRRDAGSFLDHAAERGAGAHQREPAEPDLEEAASRAVFGAGAPRVARDPGEQPERDDQHRSPATSPTEMLPSSVHTKAVRPARQTRSTTIVGTAPRRGGESRVSGASVRSDRRAMCTYGRRPYAMFPVAGVAFLRRGRGLRSACAAGRGTAA